MQITLHPPPNPNGRPIVRFVAPSAGSFLVTINFYWGTNSTSSGIVSYNVETAISGSLSLLGVNEVSFIAQRTYSNTLILKQGDRIDAYVINFDSNYNNDQTPIDFMVTEITTSITSATTRTTTSTTSTSSSSSSSISTSSSSSSSSISTTTSTTSTTSTSTSTTSTSTSTSTSTTSTSLLVNYCYY